MQHVICHLEQKNWEKANNMFLIVLLSYVISIVYQMCNLAVLKIFLFDVKF